MGQEGSPHGNLCCGPVPCETERWKGLRSVLSVLAERLAGAAPLRIVAEVGIVASPPLKDAAWVLSCGVWLAYRAGHCLGNVRGRLPPQGFSPAATFERERRSPATAGFRVESLSAHAEGNPAVSSGGISAFLNPC